MEAPDENRLIQGTTHQPRINSFGSPAILIKTGSFASPPRDGFALVQVINNNDEFSTDFRRPEKNG
jgi:hypothetical protein